METKDSQTYFQVIIVLLNVLIAVASDSYEKCLLKSQMLFGRYAAIYSLQRGFNQPCSNHHLSIDSMIIVKKELELC